MPQEPVAQPNRPAHLPHGRWLGDFEPLSAFERKLVTACARGEVCEPDNWNGKRPEADAATEANTIRAEIIRFLALGGDVEHPVHEAGVMMHGGWITGVLSLHQARVAFRLDLRICHFDSVPVFTAASLPELSLSGSKVPGLSAGRIVVKGVVFLRDGFEAIGEVRLVGARIGGSLDCENSTFCNPGGKALSGDRMVVKGGVFLRNRFEASGEVRLLGAQIDDNLECNNSTLRSPEGVALFADRILVKGSVFLRDGFETSGEVRLLGAQIGGSLECNNSKFSNPAGKALSGDRIVVKGNVFVNDGFSATGEVRLLGAQINGNVECDRGNFSNPEGDALNAQSMVVKGGLILRRAIVEGAIKLTAARIGTLIDDITCWQTGDHFLDGLDYDRIIGPTDAAARTGWLNAQRKAYLTSDFRPQPWEQLIKTLRDMGHPYEAAEVAIAKQKQLRKAGQLKGTVRNVMHWLYGKLAGYGHRPIWTVYWMAAVCMMCSIAYYVGSELGVVGPSSPLIHASSSFDTCGARGEAGKQYWTSADCPMPPEYTTFQPFFYSVDLILPLVDLQQDSDWAPIVSNANGETLWAGRALRWLMWFEILFGWMASLTLVAVLGRLVEKD